MWTVEYLDLTDILSESLWLLTRSRERTYIRNPVRELLYLSRWEKMVAWTVIVATRVGRCNRITGIFLSSADMIWFWTEKLVRWEKEEQKMIPMFHLRMAMVGLSCQCDETVGGRSFGGTWEVGFEPKFEKPIIHTNVYAERAFGKSEERNRDIN